MNSNQKIAEIIREEKLLDPAEVAMIQQWNDEFEKIVPNATDYLGLQKFDRERDAQRRLFRKLRDMVEGAADKPKRQPWDTIKIQTI